VFISVNTVLFLVSTGFSFISTKFTVVNAAFFFISTVLNFVRTVLNLVRTVLNFVRTVLNLVRTVLNFVRTVFFFVSTVLNFVSSLVSFVNTVLEFKQFMVARNRVGIGLLYRSARESIFSLLKSLKFELCVIYFTALCAGGGGKEIEKILPTDRAVPTLFKQIQRKYFFDQGIGFFSISSVKVFFPTCVI
jgi:hypothetical protein